MTAKKPSSAQQCDRTVLLSNLWAIQDEKGYLSTKDVERLAKEMCISTIELEGIISFYHFFRRRPAGEFTIYLNNSIVSEFKGFQDVRKAFEKATGGMFGGVDPTGTFGLFETSCIGLSDQEPAALINMYPFTELTPSKVRTIIGELRNGADPRDICDELQDNIRYYPNQRKSVFFRPFEAGKSLETLKTKTPDEIVALIKDSQLSGMGGAFFPTGVKWELCRKQDSKKKYIICNADEGEPGTFKDRALLRKLPGLLIQGMIAGGYAIGAHKGIIYLRAEYRYMLDQLQQVVDSYREMGWLGKGIPTKEPFDFDIRIQLGAGAYVCGEETALIESLEGKRGEPRTKQYFPVERGYLQQPTVVNNVETLCAAARILELGVPYFTQLGTPLSRGTKLMSISGDCSRPGVYEIEWGMTVGELLQLCGAEDPKFIQISGPAGECIPDEERYRRLCMEDLLCGGSIMVFNSERDIIQILRNYSRFFQMESCGLCTPCRAGNLILAKKLNKLFHGLGNAQDLEEMQSWGRILKLTSRCGLGKTSPNSLMKALEKFPAYFDSKIRWNSNGFDHDFDPEKAVQLHKEIYEHSIQDN